MPFLFHIVATTPVDGDAVLVEFSDGKTAIYQADELENLRIKRKDTGVRPGFSGLVDQPSW
jgi:hypothetical protein